MSLMKREKMVYKKCKLELVSHVAKRAIERNFPIEKIRSMLFRGRWGPHIVENRKTCICKDELNYWTIIIATIECHIFIITVYQSTYREIRESKRWR